MKIIGTKHATYGWCGRGHTSSGVYVGELGCILFPPPCLAPWVVSQCILILHAFGSQIMSWPVTNWVEWSQDDHLSRVDDPNFVPKIRLPQRNRWIQFFINLLAHFSHASPLNQKIFALSPLAAHCQSWTSTLQNLPPFCAEWWGTCIRHGHSLRKERSKRKKENMCY